MYKSIEIIKLLNVAIETIRRFVGMCNKLFKFFLFVALSLNARSQLKKDFTYFDFPISLPAKLNGNFAEMRPNHFHMGLDISTDGKENLPLYAPADGFVSRIKVEQGGFGNALYISHPNGNTTLYAHLNSFSKPIQDFLESKQYALESWKVDLKVPEKNFEVKKGQLIGYTGNTGSSEGPHLHYEIRDSRTENCLNPLPYILSIKDIVPPSIYKLAFYDREKSIYEQSPIIVSLVKNGNIYTTQSEIILPFKNVFIAVHADDKISGSNNHYGIYKAALLDKQEVVISFELENISYEKTRFQNGHIDYLRRIMGGPYYQMLFPSMGFGADIYSPTNSIKSIELGDSTKEFTIVVSDIHGNASTALFKLKGNTVAGRARSDSENRMVPGTVNFFEDDLVRFVFPEDAFYDAFNFSYKISSSAERSAVSFQIQMLPDNIPTQSYFDVSIKPNRASVLLNPDRIIMKKTLRGRTEVKKARLERGSFSASFRDFGSFQLLQDLEPPVIGSNLVNGKAITSNTPIIIDVADNNKAIKDFKARLDNKWLLFYPKGSKYYYYPDNHFPLGEHKLSIVVIDEAGNTATKDWVIKR